MTKIENYSYDKLVARMEAAQRALKELQRLDTRTQALLDASREAVAKAEALYEVLAAEYIRRKSRMLDALMED